MDTQQKPVAFGLSNYIQVMGRQDGDAPINILEAWRGLTLFADPVIQLRCQGEGSSVHRYVVPADKALQVLEQKDKGAALYWKECGYPGTDKDKKHFFFLTTAARAFCGVFTYEEPALTA